MVRKERNGSIHSSKTTKKKMPLSTLVAKRTKRTAWFILGDLVLLLALINKMIYHDVEERKRERERDVDVESVRAVEKILWAEL